MSVSRRVIHHGLYFAVLGPLIGVLFLVLYIFFAKEPLVLLVIIQVLPLFLLLSITTGAIPALLAGVVMSRIITRLPGLDISCPETDSLS
ncbi:hypothetical protein MF517_002050 [Escherichia coli]|nr:hypothetical protein [Escherichia coli]EGF5390381.1 hypothetical protein [Escherichia coli]EIW6191173.1 hypothetical protein [Escherichia coli]HBM9682515.1 hypothetical protein [Escherichia coli]